MLLECYAGETIRITAKDLIHSDTGPVTAGAVVTITIFNPDGSQFATATADNGGAGDDWHHDFAGPSVPGEYPFTITATKTGATAKAKDAIRVRAF